MAHAHTHAAPSAGYYLEQLCAIGCAGVLGIICVLMHQQQWLGNLLAPQFYLAVLLGGIGLIALVTVRMIAIWQATGQAKAVHQHDHDHEHGENCGHDHHHHHAEEYAWTPAKYAVLIAPMVMLYVVGYLNLGFSDDRISRDIEGGALEAGPTEIKAVDGKTLQLGFRELAEAAYSPTQRDFLQGKTGQLTGMFMRLGNDKEFTLYRLKINCCASDAKPIGVRILSPKSLTQIDNQAWVEATGQIQFRKLAGQDKYLPVLQLAAGEDVKKLAKPPANNYDTE